MNIYEELYKYLQRQMSLSKEKLIEYNKLNISFNLLKKILEEINFENINIENIENLTENLDIEEKNNIQQLTKQLKNVNVILYQLENNVNSIDETAFSKILDFFETSLKQKYINNLKTLKNTNEYINDPTFVDEDLIEAILNLKKDIQLVLSNYSNTLINKLRKQINVYITNLYKTIGRKSYLIKELDSYINKIEESYMKKFNFSGPIEEFDSLNQMQEFFNIIEDSTLDKDVIFELILEFCKYNVDFQNKRLSIKDTMLITNIEQNAKAVVNHIEDLVKEKNNDTEENIATTLQYPKEEINLTEEEQKIYEDIKEIVNNHSNEVIEKIFVDLFEDDLSLDNRKSYYGTEENLNWDIIITDITKILEPNLKNNKEAVFEAFKYILNLNSREIEIKKKDAQLMENLIVSYSKIGQVLHKNDNMIKKYFSLDVSRKNYIDALYEMILNGRLEEVRSCIDQLNSTIEYINLNGILLKMYNFYLQIKEYIDNKIISNEIIEEINKKTDELLLDYEKANSVYNNSSIIKTMDSNRYVGKNLIYFMPNDLDNYSGLYYDELEKSVTKLLEDTWQDALKTNRNHFLAEVYNFDQSGRRVYYDKDKFNVYRAKGRRLTRTGFITINMCEENYQKIKKKYNIDISHTFIGIVGVIYTPRSNHNEYEYINDYVREKNAEIMYLVDLFANKNSNEEELFEIVEKCIKFSDIIKKGDVLRGNQK